MELSIIIACYNSERYINTCLDSIFGYKIKYNYETIIADNNSNDSTRTIVSSYVPKVTLIKNSKNIGFAGAINVGIQESKGKFLLILNPDIILKGNTINKLLQFASSEESIGIIAPKLLNPDGTLQESCRAFYSVKTIILRRTIFGKIFPNTDTIKKHLMLDWDHNTPMDVDWILGACFLIRREVLERCVGYFDEDYKLYFEDVDICYRMKEAGYKVCYYPSATCIHDHRRESAKGFNRKTYWHIRSAIHFFNKHGWRFW